MIIHHVPQNLCLWFGPSQPSVSGAASSEQRFVPRSTRVCSRAPWFSPPRDRWMVMPVEQQAKTLLAAKCCRLLLPSGRGRLLPHLPRLTKSRPVAHTTTSFALVDYD